MAPCPEEGWIAYWLPADGPNGMLGTAIAFPSPAAELAFEETPEHLLFVKQQPTDQPMVYYAGSCWDKVEPLTSFEAWTQYVRSFSAALKQPVSVTIT